MSSNIQVAHMRFIDKLCKLLVLLNLTNMVYRIRIILKYISNISKVLILEGLKTINVLSIYQDYSTTIHNGIPRIDLQFEVINMIKSLLQSILLLI